VQQYSTVGCIPLCDKSCISRDASRCGCCKRMLQKRATRYRDASDASLDKRWLLSRDAPSDESDAISESARFCSASACRYGKVDLLYSAVVQHGEMHLSSLVRNAPSASPPASADARLRAPRPRPAIRDRTHPDPAARGSKAWSHGVGPPRVVTWLHGYTATHVTCYRSMQPMLTW
jgi:hypothetical protein